MIESATKMVPAVIRDEAPGAQDPLTGLAS